MLVAHRIRLDPNKVQATSLARACLVCILLLLAALLGGCATTFSSSDGAQVAGKPAGWKARSAVWSNKIAPDLTERISASIAHAEQFEKAPLTPSTSGGVRARMRQEDEARKSGRTPQAARRRSMAAMASITLASSQ